MSENEEKQKEVGKAAEKLADIFIEHINFEQARKLVVKKAVGAKRPQSAEIDDLYKNGAEKNSD